MARSARIYNFDEQFNSTLVSTHLVGDSYLEDRSCDGEQIINNDHHIPKIDKLHFICKF